jgi:hypothetical protein
LIELGGLISKAGLIELTGDDRAVIFGLLVEAAAKLRQEEPEQQMAFWRRKGRREFDASGLFLDFDALESVASGRNLACSE